MVNFSEPTPLCISESNITCSNPSGSYIIDTLNATSFVVNIIHVIILRRLPSLKGKPYLAVLVSMSCVDIWYNISTISVNNCELRSYINTRAQLPALWNLIICVLFEVAGTLRYIVQCISSVERYLAVVKPYIYVSSSLVAHIGKLIICITFAISTMIMCKVLSQLNSNLFIHPVLRPITLTDTTSGVIYCALIILPSIPILVLLPLTWKEIQRLQHATPQHVASTKFAAKYVMIINIVFICLMAPTLILLMLSIGFWSKNLQPPTYMEWVYAYSHGIYGVINSLIYCVMSPVYRETFVKIFIPKICHGNKVTSIVAVTTGNAGATIAPSQMDQENYDPPPLSGHIQSQTV